jgi:hypothetical protein
MEKLLDINFDFKAEASGRDSDRYSPTLQEYHRILWSKPLPNGVMFTLVKISENRLYHKSELGEFFLSSDRVITTFSKWKRLKHIISQISKNEIENFYKIANTIGGIVIWPSNRINHKMTINGERGFNRKISDRFDLTIECIRRYYQGKYSPLYEIFKRYSDFFSLFDDFRGYIDFFLLQDIVTDDYSTVNIAMPFDNFNRSPVPNCLEEYLNYKRNTIKFIESRNIRIKNLYEKSFHNQPE